jgi:HAD superfamily hydrolase (TIGR01509 family)
MKERIKAVVFDIGGVLLSMGETGYRQAMAQLVGATPFPHAEYEKQMPALQKGEIEETEVWESILGQEVPFDLFDECYLKHFVPIPEMLKLATDIRSRNIRTAILSNTQTSHSRLMRGIGFLKEFDPIVMSNEVGSRKPEAAIFQYMLDQLQLSSDSVIYIDDVLSFVEMGRSLGFHATQHRGNVDETRTIVMQLLNGQN